MANENKTENENKTGPSAATRDAEREEARAEHKPDRMPTAEEERAAPSETDPAVASSYEEMAKRGADLEGEGRVP